LLRTIPAWAEQAPRKITEEGITIGVGVSNSAIVETVNKLDPAVLKRMAKIFADPIAATAEAKAEAEARAAGLASSLGFTSSAVAGFFKILGNKNALDEQIPSQLIEIATHFTNTKNEISAFGPDDARVAELAHRAKQALNEGRLAESDRLLDEAKEAELIDLGWRRADALYMQGYNGDNAALSEAIATYQMLRKKQMRAREPVAWGQLQLSLGDALAMLGRRESGTAHLEEAVAAYRLAYWGSSLSVFSS
jgi:hypothetical protein